MFFRIRIVFIPDPGISGEKSIGSCILDPNPQYCLHAYLQSQGESAELETMLLNTSWSKFQQTKINPLALIFLTFLLIVYLNTNLFQVKRNPVPPLCHPKQNCAMAHIRRTFAAEKWTVQYMLCVQMSDTRTVTAMSPIPILAAKF